MRFAIFGDIHANLHALQTVLADAESEKCTHFVCMGDVVGYNAYPKECLDIIRHAHSGSRWNAPIGAPVMLASFIGPIFVW